MQIFDENGKPIQPSGFDCTEVGAVECPNCGTIFITADVIVEKTKERICPNCGTDVGCW